MFHTNVVHEILIKLGSTDGRVTFTWHHITFCDLTLLFDMWSCHVIRLRLHAVKFWWTRTLSPSENCRTTNQNERLWEHWLCKSRHLWCWGMFLLWNRYSFFAISQQFLSNFSAMLLTERTSFEPKKICLYCAFVEERWVVSDGPGNNCFCCGQS